MTGNWGAPLRQLHNFLVRNDEELECLRSIDIKTPDLSVPLDLLIESAVADAAHLSRSTNFHIYVSDGVHFCLAKTFGARVPPKDLSLEFVRGTVEASLDRPEAGLVQ